MDGEIEENEEHPTSPDPPIWAEVYMPFLLLQNKKFLFFGYLYGGVDIICLFLVQIMRFFSNPRKPMILALARPDPKKNITTLVKAFGECRPLRELANLVKSSSFLLLFTATQYWFHLHCAFISFLYYFTLLLQTLIMGNRDGIDEMSSTNSSVLMSVLKLIDKHDLYGQVAYPKHHKQADVPEIYRLAAKTKVLVHNRSMLSFFYDP